MNAASSAAFPLPSGQPHGRLPPLSDERESLPVSGEIACPITSVEDQHPQDGRGAVGKISTKNSLERLWGAIKRVPKKAKSLLNGCVAACKSVRKSFKSFRQRIKNEGGKAVAKSLTKSLGKKALVVVSAIAATACFIAAKAVAVTIAGVAGFVAGLVAGVAVGFCGADAAFEIVELGYKAGVGVGAYFGAMGSFCLEKGLSKEAAKEFKEVSKKGDKLLAGVSGGLGATVGTVGTVLFGGCIGICIGICTGVCKFFGGFLK